MADLLEGPQLKVQVFEDALDDNQRQVRFRFMLSAVWQRWFAGIARTINLLGSRVQSGRGSPEGIVTANLGALYLRQDGGVGSTLYVKESDGNGTNTGWTAK